jgi:prepilin-type N-terminal cleavage/methylation domain-containing protein
MTQSKLSGARGFTLIELLVVIAIIGLLSSVVLASLNSARQKGRDARRIADIKQIQLALELYFDANGGYPTSLSVANLVTPGYIAAIPTDPSNTSVTYDYAALGSGTSCTTYHLGAALETAHSVLNGDSDAAAGTVCTGGGTDFAGTDTVVCAAHTPANTGAKCFDVKP